jgi:hypothetical protein
LLGPGYSFSWFCQTTQLDFDHIQPTAVLGCLTEFQFLESAAVFLGWKDLIENCRFIQRWLQEYTTFLAAKVSTRFFERGAHGLMRHGIHYTQLHKLTCQQTQGPVLMSSGCSTASCGSQSGFCPSIQITFSAWMWIFIQSPFQAVGYKPFAEPFHTGTTNVQYFAWPA